MAARGSSVFMIDLSFPSTILVLPFLTVIRFFGSKPMNENSANFFGPSTDSKR